MVDVEKQVSYWRTSAREDWAVGRALVQQQRARHGLFFVHLALEKVLKALVCRATRDLAPHIHNLVRLSELARLSLADDQLDLLAEMNAFNVEGRYPEAITPPPSPREARDYIARTEPVFQWLMSQL